MRSPPGASAEDDIFGPSRIYATDYCSPRPRPSMISAKYRQKEERRKVLKISMNKLRKIEDPESSLCRSVLINNTVKRLQKEAREEKNNKYSIVRSDPILPTVVPDPTPDFTEPTPDFAIDTEDILLGAFPEEEPSRKRPLEVELEDCDVQDVLSQFYMPPTPRLLTSIDDDEDLDIVASVSEPKRPRLDDVSSTATNSSSFSCGHASMFGELQNSVFHSLIASLET